MTIKTRAGTRTVRPTLKAPAGVAPPAPGTPAPAPGTPPPAPGQPGLTRNDDAGRQAMNQVLRLEWASFGSSGRTAEYRRLFIDPDGAFRFNQINWNDVSGESCGQVIVGAWALKEGYTTDANGGGTVVKITITPNNGQAPFDALLGFPNAEPNNVYEGPQLENKYERNDQIAQNC